MKARAPKIVLPAPHLEKINAALANDKLPGGDKASLEKLKAAYAQWIAALVAISEKSVELTVAKMVDLLNGYRNFLDVEIIFDSEDDFLYRQKGQLKLDT